MIADAAAWRRALALLERVLEAPGLEREYPLVFDPRFSGELVTIEEDGEVRAACAILPRVFVRRGERLAGGLIGSVATDPDHRGRGLGTRLLNRAEARLRERGGEFALLWADDEGFYRRRGYERFGAELDFVVLDAVAERLPEPGEIVRSATPRDHAEIHALYQSHALRVERTPEETAALLACPDMRTLVVERGGILCAYACEGRGRDLQGVVHEWGGGGKDVAALVRGLFELRRAQGLPNADVLFVMAPPAPHPMLDLLARAGAQFGHGILGLAKPLGQGASRALSPSWSTDPPFAFGLDSI